MQTKTFNPLRRMKFHEIFGNLHRLYVRDATIFVILPNRLVHHVRFNAQRQTMMFWYVLESRKTLSKHCTAAHVVRVDPLRSRDWCCAAF